MEKIKCKTKPKYLI